MRRRFSAALCRGLIEAWFSNRARADVSKGFPRLYAAASLKRHVPHRVVVDLEPRFPRLYAAASLKPSCRRSALVGSAGFSAALCRGLIEALLHRLIIYRFLAGFPRLYAAASLKRDIGPFIFAGIQRFPRLYAAASLKHVDARRARDHQPEVFRGFMPRPH